MEEPKTGTMRLATLLPGGTEPIRVKDYSTAPYLRREFVATAIRVFEEHRDRNETGIPELQNFTCEWLTDSLIQAMYQHEYHRWEVEVKSFLNSHRHLNEVMEKFDWRHPKGGLIKMVVRCLEEFCVKVDEPTMNAIDAMRLNVNKIKHEASFSDKYKITRADYETAVRAIEEFWRLMNATQRQTWIILESGPLMDRYFDDL
jgi:hypothetical protein